MVGRAWRAALVVALLVGVAGAARAADQRVERGHYLVQFGGCNDCHTPGYFMGKPDMSRYLGGSDVGFSIPGQGVFVGRNLTPDKATGLGNWTVEQIVTAITTGVRPDGRILAPIMPWRGLSQLTHADATDIALFLKSLKPVVHKVPGPFGPSQKPDVFVMTLLPPDVYDALPKAK
ncbi:MAG TPA: cytochrome c [Acetobacteraceae bacterium]|nr:cytochrome c [Acetobacteraceae bacterium]